MMDVILKGWIRATYWIFTFLSMIFLVCSLVDFSTNNILTTGLLSLLYAAVSFFAAFALSFFFDNDT
jgi:hypothetical protein